MGALSRPGHQGPGIRPVIRNGQRRADQPRPLSCCLSAAGVGFLGILYPPWTWAFVTSGLPPTQKAWRTLTGFPCSARMRPGWGCALCTPGTAVSTRPRSILGRRLPPSNGRSLSSRHRKPSQDVQLTRHQRGFTGIHPMPSLPLACGPRTERGPLGFPASFAREPPLEAATPHVAVGTDLGH